MNDITRTPIPGIRYVLKQYHDVLLVVLEERKQTQADAAAFLGISVTTFRKILRLQSLPNFHTERGMHLARRFEDWSTLPIHLLFPEAFFTREFLQSPKTHLKSLPFRLIEMRSGRNRHFHLALPSPQKDSKSRPSKRRRHKKNTPKR